MEDSRWEEASHSRDTWSISPFRARPACLRAAPGRSAPGLEHGADLEARGANRVRARQTEVHGDRSGFGKLSSYRKECADAGTQGKQDGKEPADCLCRGVPGTQPLHVLRQRREEEGFQQISAIFEETANQEKEHAKRLFKFLEGGEVEVTAASRPV